MGSINGGVNNPPFIFLRLTNYGVEYIMPNEVEETLRVLDTQIKYFENELEITEKSYDNFTVRCKDNLDDEVYEFIKKTMSKLKEYYDHVLEESLAARKEIMDKYGIPYE